MIDRERMTSFLDILIKEGVLKWVHNKKGSFLSTPKISSISSFNSFNKEEILESKYQELAKTFSPELLEDFPTLNDFKVCYRLGLGEIPRCPICGARVAFRSQGSQYMKTCGKKECENAQVNISLTNSIKEKYGVENISQLDSIKKKKEETTLSHYGVRYLMQDPLYRKQKEDELFESRGVRNVSQLQEVKDKKRDTFQKNYGCDNYLISEEGSKKRRETLLLKYGVDNPSKSKIIKEKKEADNFEKLGSRKSFSSRGNKKQNKRNLFEKVWYRICHSKS